MIHTAQVQELSIPAAKEVFHCIGLTGSAFFTIAIAACVSATAHAQSHLHRDSYGAITRGNTATKKLALVFTGDEHAESTVPILDALKHRDIKASFFVTGNFLRRTGTSSKGGPPFIHRILAAGHYLGPHSDAHPLYCDWNNREKTLVTKAFFTADLKKNIADLRAAGALAPGEPIYFIPPYEWYNRDQAEWCKELGVTLINFTPGSGSNRDYGREGDNRFVPSQRIFEDILAYEQKAPHGLNGFLLLLHLGSGRRDPFHAYLGPLCDELTARGYKFVRVDRLIE